MIELAVRPPKDFRSVLKFREKLEEIAVANGVPVTFGGMLGHVVVRGEQGHVERFFACLDVWAAARQYGDLVFK